MNILQELKNKFGEAIIKGLINQQNISEREATSAMDIAMPTIMACIIRKVGTERGTNYLQDLVDQEGYDGSLLNKISEANVKTALKKEIDQGEKMLPVLFGSSIIKENVLNISSKLTGLQYQSIKSAYSFLTPVILNFLGKKVREKNLNKNNLVKLLKEQKVAVKQEVHDDISRELGLGIWREIEEDELIFPDDQLQRDEEVVIVPNKKTSKSPIRWFLGPLLLLGVLGLLIFGILKGFNSDTQFAKKMDKNMPITKNKPPVKPKPRKPKPPKEKSSVLTKPEPKSDNNKEDNNAPRSFENSSTSTPGIIKNDKKESEKIKTEPSKPENKPKEEIEPAKEETKPKEDPKPIDEEVKPQKKTYEGPLSLLNMVADRKVASVINFGNMHTASNEITPNSGNRLKQVAEIMNTNPNLNITVRGHHKKYTSDIDNSNADNAALSRANTVKAYLEIQGISSNRIKAESVSFKEPVNAQDPGNPKNDRISIKTK